LTGVHHRPTDHPETQNTGLAHMRRLAASSCRQAVPPWNPQLHRQGYESPGGFEYPPSGFWKFSSNPKIQYSNSNSTSTIHAFGKEKA